MSLLENLSNEIAHAASVFGEQSTLKPMAEESKARWKREIDWLLAVADHIVEFAPAKQIGKDGTCMEVIMIYDKQLRSLISCTPKYFVCVDYMYIHICIYRS